MREAQLLPRTTIFKLYTLEYRLQGKKTLTVKGV
jgi:hypothetical protein